REGPAEPPAPAPAPPPMPEMTVAAYKVQLPEGGVWLPGVLGRLDARGSGDYKVFVRDAKGFGGVVARVSPDTEEGRQVYEILKDGNWRLITFAVRQEPKRPKMWWEIVEPGPRIRIVGVKKEGGWPQRKHTKWELVGGRKWWLRSGAGADRGSGRCGLVQRRPSCPPPPMP